MGIGAELAKQCAQKGARIILAARSVDKITSLVENIKEKGGEALAIECDVTRPEHLDRLIDTTLQKWNRIDILVNNAGFGIGAPFEAVPMNQIRTIFETNLFGPIGLIQRTIPLFRKQGGGMIVNIESIVALRATPENSFYSSTKHALHAISESLRSELRRDGIRVLSICPGLIDTEFQRNKMTLGNHFDRPPKWLFMPAENCARKIVRAMEKGTRQLVITGHGKLIVGLQRLSPALLDWFFSLDYQKWVPQPAPK